MSEAGPRGRLLAAIFDVDGVLVASPHERAWREVLAGYADPVRFTAEFYQAHIAGKPRFDGARATLEGLEDAPAGISAARAGGMASVGIARLGDQALLQGAQADLVVTSLDQVDATAVLAGILRARPPTEMPAHA